MFRDIVLINGPVPKDGVADYERLRVKARPLGRPYAWDNGRAWNPYTTNGGFILVFECEEGTIYVQEIEWEVDPHPAADPSPRTYYYYERYNSLDEARAGGRGWLIEYALGNEQFRPAVPTPRRRRRGFPRIFGLDSPARAWYTGSVVDYQKGDRR